MPRKQVQMIVTVSVPVLPYDWRLTPKLNAEGARREVRDIVKTGSGHLYNVGDEFGVRLISVKPFDEKSAEADRKRLFELERLLDFVARWLSPARVLACHDGAVQETVNRSPAGRRASRFSVAQDRRVDTDNAHRRGTGAP